MAEPLARAAHEDEDALLAGALLRLGGSMAQVRAIRLRLQECRATTRTLAGRVRDDGATPLMEASTETSFTRMLGDLAEIEASLAGALGRLASRLPTP